MFRLLPHRAFIEPKARVTRIEPGGETAAVTLGIDGLLCSACAANVRARLERVPGVRSATVDLERGEAVVTCNAATRPEALVAAVEGAVILRPLRRLLARLAGHRGTTR